MKITNDSLRHIINQELNEGFLSKLRRGIFGSNRDDRIQDAIEKGFSDLESNLDGKSKIKIDTIDEFIRLVREKSGQGTPWKSLLMHVLHGQQKKEKVEEIVKRLHAFKKQAFSYNQKVDAQRHADKKSAREKSDKDAIEKWKADQSALNARVRSSMDKEDAARKEAAYAAKQSADRKSEFEKTLPIKRKVATHNGVDYYSDGSSIARGGDAESRYGAPPGHDRKMIDYDELKRLSESKQPNYARNLISEGIFDKLFNKKKGPTEKEQKIVDMFSNAQYLYFGNNMKVNSSGNDVKISGTIRLVMAQDGIEIPVDFSIPLNDHAVSGMEEFIIAVNAPVSFSIEDYYRKKYDANIQFPEDLIKDLLLKGKTKGYTSKLYFHLKDMYKGTNRDMNESKQPNYARKLIKALRNK